MEYRDLSPERRRRILRRTAPALIGGAALVAGLGGLLVGALGESDAERTAERFVQAWERSDYAAMHRELTPEARERTSVAALTAAYRGAAATATTAAIDAGEADSEDGNATVPVTVRTRAFGRIRADVRLPIDDEGGVRWAPHLAFPGLREGERLTRRTQAPPRASILDRRGRALVTGPASARTPRGPAGASIAGEVGRVESQRERLTLMARGFDADAPVGRSGLERLAEERVAGTPGGTLLAGGRALARTRPRRASPLRTTIDSRVQEAAATALAGRLGGVAALDARTAEVRALAGIAFSAPQPPGSTFKIVTATAALERRIVKPSTKFPVETKAVIDGVDLENANGESCGGSFANSFAHSCNSVFAPLGVKVGAERLVAAAERFGFNEAPQLAGAARSTIPPAAEIESPLAVGSTAIGQGRVLATPLELALMAHTIAAGGVRRAPTVVPGDGAGRSVRVTSAQVARIVERLMVGVVEFGTGRAASLAPTKVAGKTGTAELEDTTNAQGVQQAGTDTDAWFTAYAPVRRPKLAVAVLLVRAGAGGETAAPVAKTVLQAGLGRR